MSKIGGAFIGKKAFIAYLMAGDPDLESTSRYVMALQDAGADIVEIGIPFSDPVAEGEVIQSASARALASGARLEGAFDMVASLKGKIAIPLVFMSYLNPVFVYGYDRFFAGCAETGVSGVIFPDLPFEEQGEVKPAARKYGVDIITLATPASKERIPLISTGAEGFIYLVSSLGVTGVRGEITADLAAIIAEIRRHTQIPVAIGFGVGTPGQARECASIADGVIVGSAIVDIIGRCGKKAERELTAYVKEMTRYKIS